MNAEEMVRATLAGIPEEFELHASWLQFDVYQDVHRPSGDPDLAFMIKLRGRDALIQAVCGLSKSMPELLYHDMGSCIIYADDHVWAALFDLSGAVTKLTPLYGVARMVSPSHEALRS